MSQISIVKIFIASSAEMQEERKQCVMIINQLNNSHPHLVLKSIEWEYNLAHSNYPNSTNIQDAIYPLLKDTDLAVFLFHSRLGQHTLEEFEFVSAQKKRVFVYFKTGFTPPLNLIDPYKALLEFKNSLNESILYKEYKDLTDFENKFYPNLNLYLAENYRPAILYPTDNNKLSDANLTLINLLKVKEEEINQLKEAKQLTNIDIREELQQLVTEKEAIRAQLLQSEEIIRQQIREKDLLEAQLAPQTKTNALKARAFEELERGNYLEAETYLQEAAKDRFKEVASDFYELAKVKKLQFQYSEAFKYYELATQIDSENIAYLNDAGAIASYLGNYAKSIEYYEKALVIDKEVHGENHRNVATYYNNLGTAHSEMGEYSKAIDYYEQALIIDKKIGGEELLGSATRYSNLGVTYDNKGDHNKALKYYQKALIIHKKFYGEEHPDLAIDYNNLGAAYYNKGEYTKAIDHYEKALMINRQYHGEEHPDIAIRYNNLGTAYLTQGEHEKAITYHEKALTINKRFFGEEHPSIANSYNNLGTAYGWEGQYDQALKCYQKALIIYKKVYGEEHPTLANLYNNLGAAYVNKGEFLKAIDHYRRSLIIFQKFLSPDHSNLQMVKKNLEFAENTKPKSGSQENKC